MKQGHSDMTKQSTPQAGQHWRLQPDDDPFPAKAYDPVQILEVKEGWVRYWMGSFSPDNRKKVSEFVRMYDLVESEETNNALQR